MQTKLKISVSRSTFYSWALSVILLCAVLQTGCGQRIDPLPSTPTAGEPTVPHPLVQRDLAEIKNSGTLRMITIYNSSSYFIHKGGHAGFDYELMARFAKKYNLTLEVIIPEPGEDVISMLNSGKGDFFCGGQTSYPGLERWVTWSRPTNFVRKVVVLKADDPREDTLAALDGLTIALPYKDPFRPKIKEIALDAGINLLLREGRPLIDPEELITRISHGQMQAVIVDDIIAKSAMTYLPNLRIGVALTEGAPTVWTMRENSPDLRKAVNNFLRGHMNLTLDGKIRRSQTYGIIYDRYFENPKTIKRFRMAAHRPDKSGRISSYDELIRNQTVNTGLDWRFVAALTYQESKFYPNARSVADARGLMQVLPDFAGPQADSLFYPAANIRAGLRLMTHTFHSYAYLDSLDQLRFTLAEYHAGNGHICDARRIVMDRGGNPNQWENSLEDALPRLMQKRFYSKTRHGFYRGSETVEYVEEIMNRYRMYMHLVPLDTEAATDTTQTNQPVGEAEDISAIPGMETVRPGPK